MCNLLMRPHRKMGVVAGGWVLADEGAERGRLRGGGRTMRGGGMGARDRVICREGSFGWNGAGLCAGEPVGTAAARADGFAIANQPRAGRGAEDIQTIDAAASKIREQTQWISRWDYKRLMRPHRKMGVVVGAEYWRTRVAERGTRAGWRMRGQMNGGCSDLGKGVASRAGKAPPMTLCHGSATDLFPSDGTSPSARVGKGTGYDKARRASRANFRSRRGVFWGVIRCRTARKSTADAFF